MKRMRTMKRMVRLAVGSLCLLTLMVHTAPAATSPSGNWCGFTPYIDQEGGTTSGSTTSLFYVSNPDNVAHAYKIHVETKDKTFPAISVQLAAHETKSWTATALGVSGVGLASLKVETDTPDDYPEASLFLNSQGVLTSVPMTVCGSL